MGDKNRKIKWVRGERSKAEANKGRGSFGTELGMGTSSVHSVTVFFFFPFLLGLFSLPTCYNQNHKDLPQVFGLLSNREM